MCILNLFIIADDALDIILQRIFSGRFKCRAGDMVIQKWQATHLNGSASSISLHNRMPRSWFFLSIKRKDGGGDDVGNTVATIPFR